MFLRLSFLSLAFFFLCGCISNAEQNAPVIDGWLQSQANEDKYRVKDGDTIYSIAWDYGLDYRALAQVNHLPPPYSLYTGEILRMTTRSVEKTQTQRNSITKFNTIPNRMDNSNTLAIQTETSSYIPVGFQEAGETRATSPPEPRTQDHFSSEISSSSSHDSLLGSGSQNQLKNNNNQQSSPQSKPRTSESSKPIQTTSNSKEPPAAVTLFSASLILPNSQWVFPAQGKIVDDYSAQLAGNHGVNIAGKLGEPVVASRKGEVVYSGKGVRGYGNLIIIKHNSSYLSAYAYNQDVLVKVGQIVAKGQQIATMGMDDSGKVMLHFEIRYNGAPVDPKNFLR